MALTITGISPATGPKSGGNTVLISGTDMHTVTDVTIGGTAATNLSADNHFLLRAIAPAGTVGAQAVVLNGTATLAGGYTYLADDSAEPLTSTLARKFKVEVNTGTLASPSWRQVRAITDLKPDKDDNFEDDGDYDSGGWGSKAKTEISWSLELKLLRKQGFTTGIYDLGQETLRLLADEFPGVIPVRWYDRDGGPEAYYGLAAVGWKPEGGDKKALDIATATLMGQGERQIIANPAA